MTHVDGGAMQRYDNIIWDFNGTLIDDTWLAVGAVNRLLRHRDLGELTTTRYRELFGFPISDYYVRIGIDPTVESEAKLAEEFHDGYLAGLPDVVLHSGVEALLGQVARIGCQQFVLSAMAEDLLVPALERLGIAGRFTAIYGLGTRFAHSKIERGQELVKAHGLAGQRSLMVGDTDHDAEVAEALGFDAVLVSLGHQSTSRLRETGALVCESFAELGRHLDGVGQT